MDSCGLAGWFNGSTHFYLTTPSLTILQIEEDAVDRLCVLISHTLRRQLLYVVHQAVQAPLRSHLGSTYAGEPIASAPRCITSQ